MSNFQSLPGFREFYPEDCAARNALFQAWRAAARRSGFVEYDAPVLEPLELYLEKSGEEIRSQLFEFEDKGGRKVALRPEMTPSLARLVAAKAGSLRRPLKWFSIGEQFRYEKPQKGRLRSFYQFNADILGEPGPAADAECIALLVESLKSCGLKEGDFEVRVSDRKIWFLFLTDLGLNETDIPEVLTIVDKWEREEESVLKNKLRPFFKNSTEEAFPKIAEFRRNTSSIGPTGRTWAYPAISSTSASLPRIAEWNELEMRLRSLGVASFVKQDLSIVRGLAYYTGFVFEAFRTVGTARALAGGGRYDNLIQKLGGPDLPAVGFAIGDVTVGDLLSELKRPLGGVEPPDIYIVIGGADERPTALKVVAQLRATGLSVDYSFKEGKMQKQFEAAEKCGATLALVFGSNEVKVNKVTIKNLKLRMQEPDPIEIDDQLPARIREKIVK
ncbi:MAG: histidine--tRNA ligase [Opitutales bacterium]|jgi:histidyl-tRNA synthetase